MEDAEVVREGEIQCKRVQRRKLREAKRLADQDGVENSNCLEYPPFRSFSDKTDIIREWQVVMNPENLTRGVCAVCAQVFEVRSLHEVTPSEEMLTMLCNERLPEETLPSTYDFELYHRGILHPHGMTSRDSLADLRMCSKCQGALVKKTPVLPKDAIANFQYYGQSEIPANVRDAILTASPSELMLVAFFRATVVTHHYQSKSVQGGCLPEERASVTTGEMLLYFRRTLVHCVACYHPPLRDIEGSVCVVFAGGQFTPTKESLKRFLPVLVSKQKVMCLIEWLISNNEWYKSCVNSVQGCPEGGI